VSPGREEARLVVDEMGPVRRVRLEVGGPERLAGFDDPAATDYGDVVERLLGSDPTRVVWAYTPMALPLIDRIDRALLVYDVMDDLASFAFAAPAMRLNQERLLRAADLVFTGGRSIHAGVEDRATAPVHLFPSGVEPEHYAAARRHRAPRGRPVAGYVGVIDERLDLDLVAGLAARLPGWDVEMVGPVFKIDPATLPQAPNLRYRGIQEYARLPAVMGGFDVALMPFALNDATRAISPTKTLEYLAAGLPVVSTRVPDVVADLADVVALRDDAAGFAAACEEARARSDAAHDRRVRRTLRLRGWDGIAGRMQVLMEEAAAPAATTTGRVAASNGGAR
jgi:glycosyltransferase involved in cell wall biosynthesis